MKRSLRSMCLAAVACLALVGADARADELLLDIVGGDPTAHNTLPNSTFVMLGFRFELLTPRTVTALGMWDEGSDGLSVPPLNVGLWDIGGNLLSTTAIDNSSTPVASTEAAGRWLFNDVTPVNLAAGNYILAVQYINGGVDQLRNNILPNMNPDAAWHALRFLETAGLQFPTFDITFFPGDFGPNALLATGVPEPASLGLLALGGATLLRRGRRN